MTSPDFLRHLDRESARFRDVLGDVDPSARVPSCPDWSAADLLRHLTEVQWFWGEIVERRLQEPPDEGTAPQRAASYADQLETFTTWSDRLHRSLGEADPDQAVWMWAEDRTVGYVLRRQAHEALIHRLDAELAAGQVTPLEAELAADGVHEVLDVMFGGCPPWGDFTPSGTQVRVEATDTGLVVPVALGRFVGTDPKDGTAYDEPDISVRRADPARPAAAVVRGTAEDLDAWLWHRRDDARITVEGDPGAAEQFLGVVSQPIS